MTDQPSLQADLRQRSLAFYAPAIQTGPRSRCGPEISIYVIHANAPDKPIEFEGMLHTVWVKGTLQNEEGGKYISFSDCNGIAVAIGRAVLRRFNKPPVLLVSTTGNSKKIYTVGALADVDVSSYARLESWSSAFEASIERAINDPMSRLALGG